MLTGTTKITLSALDEEDSAAASSGKPSRTRSQPRWGELPHHELYKKAMYLLELGSRARASSDSLRYLAKRRLTETDSSEHHDRYIEFECAALVERLRAIGETYRGFFKRKTFEMRAELSWALYYFGMRQHAMQIFREIAAEYIVSSNAYLNWAILYGGWERATPERVYTAEEAEAAIRESIAASPLHPGVEESSLERAQCEDTDSEDENDIYIVVKRPPLGHTTSEEGEPNIEMLSVPPPSQTESEVSLKRKVEIDLEGLADENDILMNIEGGFFGRKAQFDLWNGRRVLRPTAANYDLRTRLSKWDNSIHWTGGLGKLVDVMKEELKFQFSQLSAESRATGVQHSMLSPIRGIVYDHFQNIRQVKSEGEGFTEDFWLSLMRKLDSAPIDPLSVLPQKAKAVRNEWARKNKVLKTWEEFFRMKISTDRKSPHLSRLIRQFLQNEEAAAIKQLRMGGSKRE